MVFPSVDNFLKIFNFYQLNSIKSVKELTRSSFKYNTIDKFFDALNLNYEDGLTGLTYPAHKDEILQAINARLDLSKYFNYAGFPGSYSFNTPDCFMFKTIMLDWASTIKTFQDSTEQCTNAYSLSSDDVDKAIRGFGIDFINSRTVSSLNRRQTFLLNMCELYKIKGSPQSIIKALNIIGLDDIYITEAWVYPTRDGNQNVEIKWIPVKQPQTFDPETNSYNDPNKDMEVEYWDWGKFTSKVDAILECHWFYKKFEIIDLNWNDKDTFFHLPSLTPYFNIKIKFNNDDQANLLKVITSKVQEQLNDYLSGVEPVNDILLEGMNANVNFLSVWNGFLYTLVMYTDFLRFNELKKFTKKFGFTNLNYDNIEGENKYLTLIYRMFTYINSLDNEVSKNTYLTLLSNNFAVTSVPNGYCSYEEVKYWWLNTPYTNDDIINGLNLHKEIVKLTRCEVINDNTYIQLNWNESYNYGYYDIELCTDEDDSYKTWKTLYSNQPVICQSMSRIIPVLHGDMAISPVDLYNKIRIVHHHTENNIPTIFFQHPFNFGGGNNDSTMDMIYHFNDKIIHDSYYKNTDLYKTCLSSYFNITNEVSKKQLISALDSQIKSLETRNVDRDCQYRSYMNSFLKYATSIFDIDRDIIQETTYKKYISDITYNYKNYISHDGEKLNFINIGNKYPQNKKWNWAISYGEDINSTYYFLNYEATKWCRIRGNKLISDREVSINSDIVDSGFGIPIYDNGNVYINVTKSNTRENIGSFFVMTPSSCIMEDEWNALLYTKKEYPYSEELKNLFENVYGVQTYVNEDKLIITAPPSDIYPSTVSKPLEYKDQLIYFSDLAFKPDSRLAKKIVVAKIDSSYSEMVYTQIANITRGSGELLTNIHEQYIPVYHDPYNTNTIKNYKFEDLLKYLYTNSYTLDYNSGFIYKPFNYYLDECSNYLYIKCVNNVPKTTNELTYKWVRVRVSREWSYTENRKSIYYKLNNDGGYVLDAMGKRIPTLNTGDCDISMSYKRIYDSSRYLRNPVIKTNRDYIYVDNNTNKVLVLDSKNGFRCQVKVDSINQHGNIQPRFANESNLKSYVYNGHTSIEVATQLDTPLLYDVTFGINQDLFDYINARLDVYADSIDQYESVLVELADGIQEYFKNLGYSITLDVYNAHIFRSRLVRNIVNFYKPKRDRMLSLMSQMELDTVDNVLCDIADENHNHLYLNSSHDYKSPTYNKKENSLCNRSRIKQQIDEYVPFNDLIYLKDTFNNSEVVNFREVYPYENVQDTKLEIFDKIDNLDNYTLSDNGIKYSEFYCSGFNTDIDGFYFHTLDYPKTYTNTRYFFINKKYTFICNYDINGNKLKEPDYISLERWFCFEYVKRNGVFYKAAYISDKNISSVPYLTSDGEPMKYCQVPKNIESYDDAVNYLANIAIYDVGFFQYRIDGNKSSSYIKYGLRYVEPSFYMGSFEDPKYNGYYYINRYRFNMPVYVNKYGKMISFYDLSYLPNNYLDLSIKDYNVSNKYWIITDYCQIPDISEATYIAYCSGNDTNIFNANTGTTKLFYKFNPIKKDLMYASYYLGYSIDMVADDPKLLSKLDQDYHVKYDMSREYSNLINRRIFQGTLPVKYEPCSYINFRYDMYLNDMYVQNDNYVTNVILTDVDKGIVKDLNKNYFNKDFWGYQYGSISINLFTSIEFKTDLELENNNGVFLRAKCISQTTDHKFLIGDLQWHTYYFKKISSNVCKLYIDGKDTNTTINLDIKSITIDNVNCHICEYAIFNYDIPDWYLLILHDYGVFTYRKEQSKLYKNTDSNNYTPLFNINNPRTCYGKFVTGLPENIEGDRFSSTLMDSNYHYINSTYDGKDRYNTYKWNAAGFYNQEKPLEVSMLWSKRAANKIYDRYIEPKLDNNNEVVGITVTDRKYVQNRLKLNNTENIYCEKQRYLFCDGQEFCVPSNYLSPFSYDIPVWWNKEPSQYKTGSVQHRPLTIAIKDKQDEYYPVVTAGGKKGRFFDEGLSFDGGLKSNCDNPHIFNINEVDENTKFVSTIGLFEDDERLKDKEYSRRTITETRGDTYLYDCGNTESNIFYDPNMSMVTQEMKDSHVYHTTLMLDKFDGLDVDISGKYTATKIPEIYKQKYDFDYGYINCRNYNIKNLLKNLKQNNFILNTDNLYLSVCYVAVLTYDKMCRYYIWEIREYKNYISTEKSDHKSVFKTKDGNPQYYHIQCRTLATNYVKCRYIINNPDDRFLDIKQFIYPKNYEEVVGITVNYGATQSINIDPNIDLDNMYTVYTDKFKFGKVNNVGDIFDMAYNIKKKDPTTTMDYRLNNMYYVHNNYDYINQLQLDICCQPLCKWRNTLSEELRTSHYVDVKQDKLDTLGFRSFSILKFIRVGETVNKIKKNIISNTDYYLQSDGLYIRNDSYWYGPFRHKNIEDKQTLDKLYNICCHINVVYVGDSLYVRTSNDGWVSANYYKYAQFINKKIYETYLDKNHSILINVPYTDKKLDDWTYFVDEQKIETTVCRYKKLYNRGHDQLGYFGSELSQDPMDDVYFGKGNHETILDRLYIYVYYICTMPISSITLIKPEESESV